MARSRLVQQPKSFIRWFSMLNRGWFKLTGGRIGNTFHGAPVVLLTTTGRKTGKPRTWPLLTVKDGDNYVFAGSNGGHDQHPAWYLNLVANPEVTVQDHGRTIRARARVTADAERSQLYERFVDVYKTYAEYADATDRQIPVVVVEPS